MYPLFLFSLAALAGYLPGLFAPANLFRIPACGIAALVISHGNLHFSSPIPAKTRDFHPEIWETPDIPENIHEDGVVSDTTDETTENEQAPAEEPKKATRAKRTAQTTEESQEEMSDLFFNN